MMNVYYEYGYRKEITLPKRLFECFLLGLCLALLFCSFFVPILVPVVFAVGFLAFFYHRSLKMEFEYILIDDDFTIDKIIAKMKRKKVTHYNLNELEEVSLYSDDYHERHQHKRYKVKSYVSKLCHDPVYALMFRDGGRFICVLIQADETMIEKIRMRHARVMQL